MSSRESAMTTWEIATEAEIRASPAQVWAVLADTASYPQWNPFIVELHGDLVESATIQFRFVIPPAPRLPGTALVLKVASERELRWAGHFLAPWLFRAEHYHLLTRSGGGGTLLRHGEIFSGLLAAPMWPLLRLFGRPVYVRFNQALRQRAEQGPHGSPS
jgi:hypothetical protein